MASVVSSLRYLLADLIGDDDDTLPPPPKDLPDGLAPVVDNCIRLLVDYQGTSYAELYVHRLGRFVGRTGIDAAMLGDIAQLMARRMSYQDPIRIAQLKLVENETHGEPTGDRRKFRIDELVGALPAVVAEPVLDVLEWVDWTHAPVSIRFSAASRWGIRRLKIEAALKRWRLFSVRYAKERVWVERWLHMIDRSLTRQPQATSAIIQTATMIEGYGSLYRHGLADWHAIIDGLVKPTFDGVLPLFDLAGSLAEARAAVMPDARQIALKRKIAEIRARALDTNSSAVVR
ncbi:DUF6537 domain-containing protein [Bradyrhizobium sp. S69]|uniref:DUF6537 domain-containing protein n=1 Tax=Bradyrhizobium sp. S69 TaxID=1641856 RepID=UPI00131DF768|nr:DUF6537 domain-containing protein [Bradyrhizobium sp. S69]